MDQQQPVDPTRPLDVPDATSPLSAAPPPPPPPPPAPAPAPAPSDAGSLPPAPTGAPVPPPPSGVPLPPLPGPAYPPQAPPAGGNPYLAAPPALTPEQERTWGMLAHAVPAAAMVLSAGTLGFVGSLVIYVMFKDRGEFVRTNARNSLNVQLMTLILCLISLPLMLVLIGFLTYGLALLGALIIHIVGAVKANRGEWFVPPLTPTFVK